MLTPVLLASRRCFKGALSAQLLSSRSVVSRPEGHLSRQVHQPLPVRAASNFPPRWDESKTFDQRNQPPASSYTRKWPHGVAAHAGMKGSVSLDLREELPVGGWHRTPPSAELSCLEPLPALRKEGSWDSL